MRHLPEPLAALGRYRQFILYRLVPDGAKMQKKPIDPRTLVVADPHNPAAWATFDEVAAILPVLGPAHGIGFVFTDNDPFWFLDIDSALDGSAWSQTAAEACSVFAGCAIEVSQSGRGLHIFGTGTAPAHSCRNAESHLEFYTSKRFVALTGTNAIGNAEHDSGAALGEYIARYFPPSLARNDDGWWSDRPVPQWRGPVDDDKLIARALRSRSASSTFGTKAAFADLWDADPGALAAAFPADQPGAPYNASNADAALAQHLCFWTGNDAARIERLMRASKLARSKWDDREDYLPRTIRKAAAMQTEFLQDVPPPSGARMTLAPAGALVATRVLESTFIAPEEQVTRFAGITYVVDEDKFLLPSGMLVDATRFNRIFGGYTFVLDAGNDRTTHKAAEAFIENQVFRFPRVGSTCFRPLAVPDAVIEEGGRRLINTWRPIAVPRAAGDTSRFWAHLAKMLPNDEDQKTLAYYMAACVQKQGHKFQWAPLIQGTTGNGKSMLSAIVRKAIGHEYCHTPRAKNIDNDFNAWMAGRTFFSVDEVYIPDKRLNILETLKEMITGTEQEVTKKGVDSATRDICGNFMFFTNHRDGIRKNRHDRRIAPFFSAQQEPADLARTGMDESYFRDLVAWLKAEDQYAGHPTGYSVLAEMLWTLEIPARYDPSTMPRAPRTSSTEDALIASRGPAEQEICEAIGESEVGFRDGWVSSVMLRRMLNKAGYKIPLGRYTEMLATLGYIPHPGLADGRVNNNVMPDGGRPRLYVRPDHPSCGVKSAGEIAGRYAHAQLGKD
jgi:hypothetical protein